MQMDSNLDAQASFAGGFFPFLPAVNYHAEMTSGEDRMSAQEFFSGPQRHQVFWNDPQSCCRRFSNPLRPFNACRSVGKVILDNLGQFSVQCIANFGQGHEGMKL